MVNSINGNKIELHHLEKIRQEEKKEEENEESKKEMLKQEKEN